MPRDADAKTRMARKLRSKKGSAIYVQRKAIVEPVFGQTKEARGLRRYAQQAPSGRMPLVVSTDAEESHPSAVGLGSL
jgi:hypothetical protein